MKKDDLEKIYFMGWAFATVLTLIAAYLCFYSLLIPCVAAHFCAIKIIFRVDDDSDRGDDPKPETPPDPGLELDIPKEELSIKRVGNIDLGSDKKIDKYYYSEN
jgi:hypothetical protein